MPEEQRIQNAQSSDLATYTILVDGEELSANYQVLSLLVEKEINRIPWAKIVLVDGDPAIQDFEVSNEELFVPGKPIEINAGYHSDEECIFKGIVIKHSIQIRHNKAQLVVECRDEAVKLTIGRKSKYFYESTDSDIFEEIIGNYRLDADIEATLVEHQKMVQYRLSDWDFCITRAQANGKVCAIDDGVITIQAPDVAQAEQLTLVYGETILDFDAEMDARNQFASVSSFGWNLADQAVTEKEAEQDPLDLNGNIEADELAAVVDLEKLEVKDGAASNDESLQEWANAKSLFSQLSKIRGRVKFQGYAIVKPNTTLMLEGVGDRFNGKVYVSAIRHQLNEGNWTTDAQFGFNPNWFSETVEINEVPAAGLLGAVHGLQVAIVTQVHDDPDGEMRVKVRMPLISGEEEGVWARVASPDAGENRGMFFRPELDDEVIVGFLNGNPNEPIVLGMLNSSAKPTPIVPAEENNEKGFVTKSEMKLLFDDDKPSVVIETPAGKKITVDDDAGVIELEDENSNVVVINSDGISMDSAGDITLKAAGDITIEGTNINLTASAEVTAEGSAGTSITSSASVKIEGALVQIN